MSLGYVLAERFDPEVLEWLRARTDVAVIDPWLEPEAWEIEVPASDAIISRKSQIRREHMEAGGGKLKIIARTGVGVDPTRVDLDAAKELRIWVTNQPGVNAASVAELVFAQMLSIARNTHIADEAVRTGHWAEYQRFVGFELANKTLGIVGMGNIGTRVALRARAFEMQLLVRDPYVPEGRMTALGAKPVSLDELLQESDFLTVHCPLNSETKGMIGARELALMKPTAYAINMARGGIIDEEALYDALSRNTIAGGILDVVDPEPPRIDHPLFSLPNILLTPHLGAGTVEASLRAEWGAAQEVVRVLGGEPPKNPVFLFD
jgi:D-3-phosphoglycerate dehydrogenase